MTLEELRIQLLDQVKNCRDPNAVGQLFVDADRLLNDSSVDDRSKKAFWEAVDHDLVVVTQEASMILGRQGALALRTVIGEARTMLSRYRQTFANQTKHS